MDQLMGTTSGTNAVCEALTSSYIDPQAADQADTVIARFHWSAQQCIPTIMFRQQMMFIGSEETHGTELRRQTEPLESNRDPGRRLLPSISYNLQVDPQSFGLTERQSFAWALNS